MTKRKKAVLAIVAGIAGVFLWFFHYGFGYVPYPLRESQKQELLESYIEGYSPLYASQFQSKYFIVDHTITALCPIGEKDTVILCAYISYGAYLPYQDKCYRVSSGSDVLRMTAKIEDGTITLQEVDTSFEGMLLEKSIKEMILPLSVAGYLKIEACREFGFLQRNTNSQAEAYFGLPVSEYSFEYDSQTNRVRIWDWDAEQGRSVTILEEEFVES